MHTHTHTHTHTVLDEGMGRAVKNSLEIIIKQVRLEGGFERGGGVFEANCSRQVGQHKKRSFIKCFFCLHGGGVTKVHVSDADRNCLAGV